jgi:hypothetical protein
VRTVAALIKGQPLEKIKEILSKGMKHGEMEAVTKKLEAAKPMPSQSKRKAGGKKKVVNNNNNDDADNDDDDNGDNNNNNNSNKMETQD